MNGAIGYVRVSTQEQARHGVSLDAQRQAIEVECGRRGWPLVGIEADEGVSAKSVTKRVGLAAAVKAIEAGQADVLVVTKLDRLSRSVIDFAKLLEQAVKKEWRIVLLDMDFDMTTASGEFMAHNLAAAAQFQRRMIGQHTKDALAYKKAQGVRLGRPSKLPPDVIERIDTLRAGNTTYRAIADALNDDGVPTGQGGVKWWPATVKKVLERAS